MQFATLQRRPLLFWLFPIPMNEQLKKENIISPFLFADRHIIKYGHTYSFGLCGLL